MNCKTYPGVRDKNPS